MKAFNPYSKGIPEKKENKSRFESRYPSIRTEEKPAANLHGGTPTPRNTPAGRPAATAAPQGSVAGAVPGVSTQPEITARQANIGKFNAGTHGELERRNAEKPDRDLLDGLEGNMRRQRGWADDEKPNELVDGISITPISRADLQKKLADQKRGGFATNV